MSIEPWRCSNTGSRPLSHNQAAKGLINGSLGTGGLQRGYSAWDALVVCGADRRLDGGLWEVPMSDDAGTSSFRTTS